MLNAMRRKVINETNNNQTGHKFISRAPVLEALPPAKATEDIRLEMVRRCRLFSNQKKRQSGNLSKYGRPKQASNSFFKAHQAWKTGTKTIPLDRSQGVMFGYREH
jgi:hypothetical protein